MSLVVMAYSSSIGECVFSSAVFANLDDSSSLVHVSVSDVYLLRCVILPLLNLLLQDLASVLSSRF